MCGQEMQHSCGAYSHAATPAFIVACAVQPTLHVEKCSPHKATVQWGSKWAHPSAYALLQPLVKPKQDCQ